MWGEFLLGYLDASVASPHKLFGDNDFEVLTNRGRSPDHSRFIHALHSRRLSNDRRFFHLQQCAFVFLYNFCNNFNFRIALLIFLLYNVHISSQHAIACLAAGGIK